MANSNCEQAIFLHMSGGCKLTFFQSAALIAGITSLCLNIMLTLTALYPDNQEVPGYSFIGYDERVDDSETQFNLQMLTAMPLLAAIVALVFCIGNRVGAASTYLVFLISNVSSRVQIGMVTCILGFFRQFLLFGT